MPTVSSGRIAVVTSVFPYTPTDAAGKPTGETVTYNVGDVIHDSALVQAMYESHLHTNLTVTEHSAHLCPDKCSALAPAAALAPAPAPARSFSPASAPSSSAATNEVK